MTTTVVARGGRWSADRDALTQTEIDLFHARAQANGWDVDWYPKTSEVHGNVGDLDTVYSTDDLETLLQEVQDELAEA